MFKQHRDGIWYFHAIRWNDLHNFELRQEEFQSGYPDELKSQSPTVDECRGHDFNATRKRSDWPDHRFRKTFYGL